MSERSRKCRSYDVLLGDMNTCPLGLTFQEFLHVLQSHLQRVFERHWIADFTRGTVTGTRNRAFSVEIFKHNWIIQQVLDSCQSSHLQRMLGATIITWLLPLTVCHWTKLTSGTFWTAFREWGKNMAGSGDLLKIYSPSELALGIQREPRVGGGNCRVFWNVNYL